MAKKKIAIVTGASRGLGLEFVKLLLKEDLDEIWMIARSEEKMKKHSHVQKGTTKAA